MLRNVIVGGAFMAGMAVAVPFVLERNGQPQAGGSSSETAPALLSAAPSQPSAGGRRVQMEPDVRGHFIGEFRLNGRPVEAMIDTGASVVAINRTTARRVGISLANADFSQKVDTANGTVHAAAARIDRMEIGGIVARNVRAVVLDDSALSGTLIGMSFLGNLKRYQVENGRLLLEQ